MCITYNSTQLSGSILSEDQGPDRVSGCDQHALTVRQWQAGQSIVCPDQGRGNQSLPTELLILLMDSSGCVPTSHKSSRKALKIDTAEETCDRFGGDLLKDENVRGGGQKNKKPKTFHHPFFKCLISTWFLVPQTKISLVIAGFQNSGASLIQQHLAEMR